MRELLPDDGVFARAPTVVLDGMRKRDQGCEVALENDLNSRSEIGTLVHQGSDCSSPTLVDFAEYLRHGHAHVREEDLVESRIARHLPQRAH